MKPYLLDTNTFWEVLIAWNKGENSELLPTDLQKNGKYEFIIPAISIAEIYSVLGKKARAQKPQTLTCERKLADNSICTNTWIQGTEARFKKKDVQNFLPTFPTRKLGADIFVTLQNV
jgi:predicted nucleic acid-binding protein